MSKAATEKVVIFCPHADKVEHKAHEKDDPMVVAFGVCYILPRIFYTQASTKPDMGKYFENLGVKFEIGFCNRCYDKVDIPGLILEKLKNIHIPLESDLRNKELVGENILCRKEITCINSQKSNKIGKPYHSKEFANQTSDLIIRFECTLRPAEYTAYVSEQTWKFNMVADACQYCIESVFPEVSTIMDRYHTMLLLSDADVHNPDQMLSMHQVAFMSGNDPQNINT